MVLLECANTVLRAANPKLQQVNLVLNRRFDQRFERSCTLRCYCHGRGGLSHRQYFSGVRYAAIDHSTKTRYALRRNRTSFCLWYSTIIAASFGGSEAPQYALTDILKTYSQLAGWYAHRYNIYQEIIQLMRTSVTNEQRQAWMAQWRRAAVALEQVQRRELARMTDAEALAAAERVLTPGGDPYRDPQRLHTSGLVEQQRIFHRRRS